MNKGILIKAGIILGFFAVTLGLAFGCSSIADNETTPEISNREDAYLTVGDITITNQDLYESMKISDGLNYLVQYAEEILLADVIANDITDADIDEAILQLQWGTDDADTIAEIQADPEIEQEFVDSYNQYLKLLGIDPTDRDALEDFVELTVAKKIITRDAILNAGDDDELKILDSKVEEYYNEIEKGSVCVLDVKFNSEAEANAVFDELLLVPNFNEGWGRYTGTEAIDTLLTSEFTTDNTDQLTDDEVFAAFLEVYNYMNPSETPIPVETTQADYCANYSDMAEINWSDLVEDYYFDDIANGDSYATTFYTYNVFLFDTLGFEEDEFNYTYSLQDASPFSMISYKVSETEATSYEDLAQTEKDALLDTLIDGVLNDNTSFAAAYEIAAEPYWEAAPLEIFDPVLKLQYENSEYVTFDNNGSETVVATVGDTEITADQLFAFMAENTGTYTAVELVQNEYLLQSEFYTEVYGDDYDYLNSNNETMVEHRENLRTMKSSFSSNAYSSYGFDSSTMTWEEFLIVAFGAYTEADLIETLYVVGALSYNITDTDDITYEAAKDVIDAASDEYLSLQASHLLLYVDFDNDFAPDDLKEYTDGLSGDDLTEYNTLAVAFETLVLSKLNDDDMTFDEVVKEFNDSLVGDATNEWTEFKAYGFHMLTQDLGFTESDGTVDYELTNDKIDGYFHEDFNAALKRIYDAYVVADKAAGDAGLAEYLDNQLVKTESGLHVILTTQGAAFDQPTAVYDNTDGDYSEGSAGTTMTPNKEQVELYIAIRVAAATNETTELVLPDSVYDAVDAYYGDVFDAYFSSDYYSVTISEYVLDNGGTFATNNADARAYLEDIVEVTYSNLFDEDYNLPE